MATAKTIFLATGNTYNAKAYLKEVGFTFDGNRKEWTAERYDEAEWAKRLQPTYSRVSARICQGVTIEKRTITDPESGAEVKEDGSEVATPIGNLSASITDRIIKALESGAKPWIKPWRCIEGAASCGPVNAVSGKSYRGINTLLLALNDYTDPRWITFKQGLELSKKATADSWPDGPKPKWLKEGQKTTEIVFWQFRNIESPKGESGDTVSEDEGSRRVPLLKSYRVFNVEQTNLVALGLLPELTKGEVPKFQAIEKADCLIALYKDAPPVKQAGGLKACYFPCEDRIVIPQQDLFSTPDAYYGTLFHEFVHSTGHRDRLGRPGIASFDSKGSPQYAQEELIAEIGAAMLSSLAGLDPGADQSAAYVGSWIKVLKGDVKFIERAAREAQKAVDHILGHKYTPEGAQED